MINFVRGKRLNLPLVLAAGLELDEIYTYNEIGAHLFYSMWFIDGSP